ncbi:MAG TPA: hypothetical protein VFR97_04140 [Capillimicrobium sp.]|nr:hypothetical protein [Capillimicrobium sp.]
MSRSIVLELGWADTRLALESWNRRPLRAVGPWAAGALALAVGLLAAAGLVATVRGAGGPAPHFPGIDAQPSLGLAFEIFGRNLLAFALHAFACVSAFVAGSSLRIASGRRRAHVALAFVAAATLFSLANQAWITGGGAAALADRLGTSPWALLATLTPHALPELTAIFLPLAAWVLGARSGSWHRLGAAAAVCTAIALPVLLACAMVETYVTSRVVLHFV